VNTARHRREEDNPRRAIAQRIDPRDDRFRRDAEFRESPDADIEIFAVRTATRTALRRVACAARHIVRPHHCRHDFAHAGYVNSIA
jgi:hypothetical protein